MKASKKYGRVYMKIMSTLVKIKSQLVMKKVHCHASLMCYHAMVIFPEVNELVNIADSLIMLIRLYNYYKLIIVFFFYLSVAQNGHQHFCVMYSLQSLLLLPCVDTSPLLGIICPLPHVWVRLFRDFSTPLQLLCVTLQF